MEVMELPVKISVVKLVVPGRDGIPSKAVLVKLKLSKLPNFVPLKALL